MQKVTLPALTIRLLKNFEQNAVPPNLWHRILSICLTNHLQERKKDVLKPLVFEILGFKCDKHILDALTHDYNDVYCDANLAIDEIAKTVKKGLDKCGLYYRIFARCKSDDSTCRKLAAKPYSRETGYLMQDYFGIRVALYFHDDIPICKEIIKKHFQVVVESITKHDSKTFSPVILNLVCNIPEDTLSLIDSNLWSDFPFDQTFEIQIRTIFSEGWHGFLYKYELTWTVL